MAKILVVDDVEAICESLTTILQYKHFEVKSVHSGDTVFTSLVSFQPDLILLDVRLGSDDGRIICQKIKSSSLFSDIPIILFSASPNVLGNYREYGADDAVPKPFSIKVLMDKINFYLTR